MICKFPLQIWSPIISLSKDIHLQSKPMKISVCKSNNALYFVKHVFQYALHCYSYMKEMCIRDLLTLSLFENLLSVFRPQKPGTTGLTFIVHTLLKCLLQNTKMESTYTQIKR